MNISECLVDYIACDVSEPSNHKRNDEKAYSVSYSWTCDSSCDNIDDESLLSGEQDAVKGHTALKDQYFVISTVALMIAIVVGPAIGPIVNMVDISSTVIKLSWRNQGALINCIFILLVLRTVKPQEHTTTNREWI